MYVQSSEDGGSEARGGDFLAEGLDRLHDLARGLLAGKRQAALIRAHPAFVDAGELGELADVQVIKVIEERRDIVLGGFDALAISAEVIAADLLFRPDGEKTVRS